MWLVRTALILERRTKLYRKLRDENQFMSQIKTDTLLNWETVKIFVRLPSLAPASGRLLTLGGADGGAFRVGATTECNACLSKRVLQGLQRLGTSSPLRFVRS